MADLLTMRNAVMLAMGIFLLAIAYNSYAFGPKETEKTVTTIGPFWRVSLVKIKHPAGGSEQFFRLYNTREAEKRIVIKPPLLLKETSEFNGVVLANTSDGIYPEMIIHVIERFNNERGYSDSRFKMFRVNDTGVFPLN